MSKTIVVSLWTRQKRVWKKADLKKLYAEATVFYLRWIPEGQTNYQQKTLKAVNLRDAKIARASFVPPAQTNEREKPAPTARTLANDPDEP
jgi:hypothetical protein